MGAVAQRGTGETEVGRLLRWMGPSRLLGEKELFSWSGRNNSGSRRFGKEDMEGPGTWGG